MYTLSEDYGHIRSRRSRVSAEVEEVICRKVGRKRYYSFANGTPDRMGNPTRKVVVTANGSLYIVVLSDTLDAITMYDIKDNIADQLSKDEQFKQWIQYNQGDKL